VAAVFVTGAGTDVGKTFVTTGLIHALRTQHMPVDAIKPVVTGFDPAAAVTTDPGRLLAALGRIASPPEIARIAPWRFSAPLAPDMAAARTGGRLDFDALVDFCRDAAAQARGHLLIEGIGGVMVPLDQYRTVLDWMTALRLPVLLVTGSYVGTISHALTALQVMARRNLEISAVVVSESPGSAATLEETIATMSRFADGVPVIGLPRLTSPAAGHPNFARILAEL
jgi:dethiobiotin synthetase